MNDGKNNGSGFMWGLLIGAAVGALVSTQKGRRIIKEITEHGLESLGNIVNLEEMKEAFDERMGGENPETEAHETPPEKKKPKLFRGLKRR